MIPTIEEILSPVSVDDFLVNFWGQTPLYIRGHADKFASVFSLDRFKHLLRRSPPKLHVTATFAAQDGSRMRPLTLNPAEAETAYRAGATICAAGLHQVVPELGRLCDGLKGSLGYLGLIGVNAYWSPDGQGYNEHFDARIATTFQLDGNKTWRYSRCPGIPWPRDNAFLLGGAIHYDRPDDEIEPWEREVDPESLHGWGESTLQPGDFLSLPAGVWHAASAQGHSFAINVFTNPVGVGGLLGSLLRESRPGDLAWRHVPPLLAGGGLHGGPNARGKAFLRERLNEAIDRLTALRDDPDALMVLLARGNLEVTDPAPPPDGPWLRVSPLLIVPTTPSAEGFAVLVGKNEVRARGKTARVLMAALRERWFDGARLAVDGLTGPELKRILEGLAGAGVLEPAPPR